MKLRFSLKDKEASLEANVEDLIEKGMDCDPDKKSRYQIRQEEKRKNREQRHTFESDPKRKTRYQIRQEEKRKAKEQQHKHDMTYLCISLAVFFVLLIILLIMASLEA